MIDTTANRAGALAAAEQASEALAALIQFARNGVEFDNDTVCTLADALKLAIEISYDEEDSDTGQLLAALVRYLEDWA